MKFLKFLSLVMMLNITLCLGSDLDRYKAFAEKEIARRIETAKSIIQETSDKRNLGLTKDQIGNIYFKEIETSIHELVEILTAIHDAYFYGIAHQLVKH